jgi:hypothetical protein
MPTMAVDPLGLAPIQKEATDPEIISFIETSEQPRLLA